TFMVTLRMLENMGPPAEPAIPAVLRNAERLGLFRDYLTAKEGKSHWVEAVAKSLDRIRRKETAEPPSSSSPADLKPVPPFPVPRLVPDSSTPSKSKHSEEPPK